jgi:hypothetical protein
MLDHKASKVCRGHQASRGLQDRLVRQDHRAPEDQLATVESQVCLAQMANQVPRDNLAVRDSWARLARLAHQALVVSRVLRVPKVRGESLVLLVLPAPEGKVVCLELMVAQDQEVILDYQVLQASKVPGARPDLLDPWAQQVLLVKEVRLERGDLWERLARKVSKVPRVAWDKPDPLVSLVHPAQLGLLGLPDHVVKLDFLVLRDLQLREAREERLDLQVLRVLMVYLGREVKWDLEVSRGLRDKQVVQASRDSKDSRVLKDQLVPLDQLVLLDLQVREETQDQGENLDSGENQALMEHQEPMASLVNKDDQAQLELPELPGRLVQWVREDKMELLGLSVLSVQMDSQVQEDNKVQLGLRVQQDQLEK